MNSQSVASKLCLSCGMCCDGTLIGHVQVDTNEVAALKELMLLEEEEDKAFFLQPCNKYCKSCTIYADRPKQCAAFSCGLLHAIEAQSLTFEAALAAIELVNDKKTSIEKSLTSLDFRLQSPSFYFKMVETKKILKKQEFSQSLSTNEQNLSSAIEKLDSLLLNTFGVTLD